MGEHLGWFTQKTLERRGMTVLVNQFSFPGAMPMEVPAFVIYIAGAIELVGGLFVMVGLLTRWAAFLCSGLMAVAYWMAHGTQGVFPLTNGGELAALYCFVFLFISAQGPGIWSVEASRG